MPDNAYGYSGLHNNNAYIRDSSLGQRVLRCTRSLSSYVTVIASGDSNWNAPYSGAECVVGVRFRMTNPSSNQLMGIVGCSVASSEAGWGIWWDNRQLIAPNDAVTTYAIRGFVAGATAPTQSAAPFKTNAIRDSLWHTAALVRYSTNTELYLDGLLVNSVTAPTSSGAGLVNTLTIGAADVTHASVQGYADVEVAELFISTGVPSTPVSGPVWIRQHLRDWHNDPLFFYTPQMAAPDWIEIAAGGGASTGPLAGSTEAVRGVLAGTRTVTGTLASQVGT